MSKPANRCVLHPTTLITVAIPVPHRIISIAISGRALFQNSLSDIILGQPNGDGLQLDSTPLIRMCSQPAFLGGAECEKAGCVLMTGETGHTLGCMS